MLAPERASSCSQRAPNSSRARAPVVAEAAADGRVALTYEGAAVAWRAQVAPTEAHLQAGVGVETALLGG